MTLYATEAKKGNKTVLVPFYKWYSPEQIMSRDYKRSNKPPISSIKVKSTCERVDDLFVALGACAKHPDFSDAENEAYGDIIAEAKEIIKERETFFNKIHNTPSILN